MPSLPPDEQPHALPPDERANLPPDEIGHSEYLGQPPGYEPHTSAAPTAFQKFMETPIVAIPRPGEQFTAQHPYLAAGGRAAATIGESLETPESLALLGLMGPASKAAPLLGRVAGAAFGTQAGIGAVKGGIQTAQDIAASNYPAALEHGLETGAGAGMAYLGGKSAMAK